MNEQEKRYIIFSKEECAVIWLIFSVSRDEIGATIQKILIFQKFVGIRSDLHCEKAGAVVDLDPWRPILV